MTKNKRLLKLSILLAVAAVVLAACTGDDDAATVAAEAPGGGSGDNAFITADFDDAERGAEPAILDRSSIEGPLAIDARVIRNGTIELRVDVFPSAWNDVRRIAATRGGYVSDASTFIDVEDDERYASGSVTLRVPSTAFDATIDDLAALGEQLSQSMSGVDVTEEFVDLEARLRHWRSVEEFTLGLMDRAVDIDDSLRIQTRLNEVQLTIEQIEGRLRYLDANTSFSTITVHMTEAPVEVAVGQPSDITRAFTQAGDIIMGAVGFAIVAAAFLLPFAILAVFGIVAWRIVRRFLPARPATPAPQGEGH